MFKLYCAFLEIHCLAFFSSVCGVSKENNEQRSILLAVQASESLSLRILQIDQAHKYKRKYTTLSQRALPRNESYLFYRSGTILSLKKIYAKYQLTSRPIIQLFQD